MPAAPLSPCASVEPEPRHAPALLKAGLGYLAVGAGVAGAVAGTAAVGGALFLVRAITGPGRVSTYSDYVFTPFEAGIPFERVTVPARDGTPLSGWWLPQGGRDRVVIGCTHYRGRKSDLIGIAGALWRAGFSAFLFDYRGHGEHVGTPVTLGYRETEDLLAAVDTVRTLAPGAAIGAIGYSMGAAVAIMGAARQPAIQAVVADSGFARQGDAIRTGVREQTGVPIAALMPLIDLLVHTKYGYRFHDVEPLRDVPMLAGRSLLIIHGGGDEVVNVRHARQLYDAAHEPKELWVLPGVAHCGAYFADRPAYCARVAAFFAHALRRRVTALPPAAPGA